MYYLDSSHVWHVAKSGNNGNSGHAGQYPVNLASNAKLTIGAAISAASAGDIIIVWPGTYAENVNLNKQLTLIGVSRKSCKIDVSSGTALSITAAGCVVKSISAINTGSGMVYGIKAGGNDLQLIDCYGEGDYDGIHLNDSSYVYMFNCRGKGKFDGIQLGNGHSIIVDSCISETDGTNTITDYVNGLVTGYCSATVIRNTVCYASRALAGTSYHVAACTIKGQVVLDNISCYAKHTGSGQHETTALKIADASAVVSGRGVSVKVDPTRGYGYGVKAEAGRLLISGAVMNVKDPTSVNSTVSGQVSGQEKTQFIDNYFDALPNDYFNEWWIIWTSGSNVGQVKEVLDWDTTLNKITLVSACTYDIQVGDTYTIVSHRRYDIKQSGNGIVRIANCEFEKDSIEGTITILDSIADIDGRVDVSKFNGSQDDALRLIKATKLLTNKAIQNKSTGKIDYYDDDGQTIILSHLPTDEQAIIIRTPS